MGDLHRRIRSIETASLASPESREWFSHLRRHFAQEGLILDEHLDEGRIVLPERPKYMAALRAMARANGFDIPFEPE